MRQNAVAAVLRERGGPFALEPVRLDAPRAGEVLVRIEAVGICHTDLSVRAGHTPGPLPVVLGHEGTGVVAQVGAGVTRVSAGQRVVLTFDSCGACPPCREGRPVRCDHWPALNLFGGGVCGGRPFGTRLDGTATMRAADDGPLHGHFFGQSSFASHALASERNAVPVPDGLPPELLAPLGCGVQTGAGAVLNVLRPAPGDTLVVFGAGGVGLAAVLAARLTPAARVIAVDLQPARLALARELGADEVVDAGAADPVAAVRQLTGGRGAECALETSGSVAALRQAVGSLAVGGSCGVVGAPPAGSEVALDVPALLGRAPRILGINQGGSVPQSFLPALAGLVRSGRLPLERLVRTYAFAEIERAAAAAACGEVVKPVLLLT
ncbi:NAD(P)-dependent alcohol dehydrogenase [Kitasatospora sp. NPDC002227]|uniref:NAD(P)-dependent alcohol dehydrogenase n=1 Tax=Kitasatospora sp. NPDC002227 TaxID=3154773 RepID=UPI00332F0A26